MTPKQAATMRHKAATELRAAKLIHTKAPRGLIGPGLHEHGGCGQQETVRNAQAMSVTKLHDSCALLSFQRGNASPCTVGTPRRRTVRLQNRAPASSSSSEMNEDVERPG